MLDIAASDALEALGGGPAVPLGDARAAARGPAPAGAAQARRGAPRAARARSRGARPRRSWPWAATARKSLDLGGGLQAVAEYGTRPLRARAPRARPPRPSRWSCSCRAACASAPGRWRPRSARRARCPCRRRGRAAGAWWCAPGARATEMRPVGLGGTKSLQDLFTDRKVPRALRCDAARDRGGRRDRLGGGRGARRALRRREDEEVDRGPQRPLGRLRPRAAEA